MKGKGGELMLTDNEEVEEFNGGMMMTEFTKRGEVSEEDHGTYIAKFNRHFYKNHRLKNPRCAGICPIWVLW